MKNHCNCCQKKMLEKFSGYHIRASTFNYLNQMLYIHIKNEIALQTKTNEIKKIIFIKVNHKKYGSCESSAVL